MIYILLASSSSGWKALPLLLRRAMLDDSLFFPQLNEFYDVSSLSSSGFKLFSQAIEIFLEVWEMESCFSFPLA